MSRVFNIKEPAPENEKWSGNDTRQIKRYDKSILMKVYSSKRVSGQTRRLVKVYVPALEIRVGRFTLYLDEPSVSSRELSEAKRKAIDMAEYISRRIVGNDQDKIG